MCTVAYYLADEGAGAYADAALTLANHCRVALTSELAELYELRRERDGERRAVA